MNNLLVYEGHQLSVLTKDDVEGVNFTGDVLFCAREVAKILGYVNERDAILKYVDASDKVKIKNSNVVIHDFRKIHNTGETFINESGLYSLILTSGIKSAKDFKRWVTSEVLPSIRKTGVYRTEASENTLGSIIEKQLLETIDAKLDERISKYKVREVEELIALFRAYGITKKKASELAYKAIRLNSTAESVLNGYMQENYEEERRRYCGQIKAYIKDLTKLGFDQQAAWCLFADEVLYKTGYDLAKTRSYLRVHGKPKATFLDAAAECKVLKDSVTIVKKLVTKKIKELNKQTA